MNGGILTPSATILEAVKAIEASHRRIAVVIDEDRRLAGTITDGDIRRCLLAGGTLAMPAIQAMNRKPTIAPVGSPHGYILDLMRRANVLGIPLVDADGRFVEIVHLFDISIDDNVNEARNFAFGLIMAGGVGARLRPLTETIPKPMVEIGGMPLIERQVRRLAAAGVPRVYIALNHLGHLIEEHFSRHDLNIEVDFLREETRLGTAGALALLPERPKAPILVVNGDILTTSDFGSLYTFHLEHAASITIAAVDYWVRIPYGVLWTSGPYLERIEEKPSQRFRCNAGIYAMSPEAIDLIPLQLYDMTDLIAAMLTRGGSVAVFPVHEFWSDIGTIEDLDRARGIFTQQESKPVTCSRHPNDSLGELNSH